MPAGMVSMPLGMKKPMFALGEGRNEHAGNGETMGPALDRR